MLHQRTQRPKRLRTAVVHARTLEDLVRMRGALQVRVQRRQLRELSVAQHTLERAPVPRLRRRPLVLDVPAPRRIRPVGLLDEPAGVGDDVPLVYPHHELRQLPSGHARRTRPALAVQDEVGPGAEGSAAVEPWADRRAGLVGAQVVLEVVRVLEHTLALHTVVVFLPVVFVQPVVRVEYLVPS